MAKTSGIHANEPQASFLHGPLLTAHQPANSETVLIAIVGSYEPSPPPLRTTTNIPDQTLNKPQPNTFLTLLSTKRKQAQQPNDQTQSSDDDDDDELLQAGVIPRQVRFCERYLKLLLQQQQKRQQRQHQRERRKSTSRLVYRNLEHFCATGGNCFHGLAPSSFPGDKNWTFALGEAKFQEERKNLTEGGGEKEGEEQGLLAPNMSEADAALTVLEEMLRTAVHAGLGQLKVVISVSDIMTQFSRDHHDGVVDEMMMVSLERLTARVFDVVIGWVEEGWVGKEEVEVCWRPFGVGRRFGVMGLGGVVPFVICDEGEE